jgi:hypothetical protein
MYRQTDRLKIIYKQKTRKWKVYEKMHNTALHCTRDTSSASSMKRQPTSQEVRTPSSSREMEKTASSDWRRADVTQRQGRVIRGHRE